SPTGQRQRGGPADPAGCAGDEGDSAVEARHRPAPTSTSASLAAAPPATGAVHRRTPAPHTSPAPTAVRRTVEPGCRRPASAASLRAMATDAAEVLPYRSTFENTLSSGMPSRAAHSETIRRLAWWQMNRSTSCALRPADSTASREDIDIVRTAARNTSRPFMEMKCCSANTVALDAGRALPPAGTWTSDAADPPDPKCLARRPQG